MSENSVKRTLPGAPAGRGGKNIERDKPLPHDIEAEAAVLGAIINDPLGCIDVAMETLGSATHFYDQTPGRQAIARRPAFHLPKHQRIYSCMCQLHEEDSPIDLLTLSSALKKRKVLDEIGGEAYLMELMRSVPTTANFDKWCVIVRDNAILRNLITSCETIKEKCYDLPDNVTELIGEAEKNILEIGEMEHRAETRHVKELIDIKNEDGVLNRLVKLSQKDESVMGIRTQFPDLDKLITGLMPGDMFVIAARPSIGKTSFALNMMTNIAMDRIHSRAVGIFSLEMQAEKITTRLLCTESGFSEKDFIDGLVTNMSKITAAATRLSKAEIYIDDTPALKIHELRSKARKMRHTHNVEVIFIDYLQLMRAETRRNDNRQEEVSAISSGIKSLAKELKIPIVVLAQLNREAEKTSTGIPKLSHLRESGAIEQDADVVAFLHRERDEQKEASPSLQEKGLEAQLIIEKNRNGPTGRVNLLFFPKTTCFRCVARIADDAIPG